MYLVVSYKEPNSDQYLLRTYKDLLNTTNINEEILLIWDDAESKRSSYYKCAPRTIDIVSVDTSNIESEIIVLCNCYSANKLTAPPTRIQAI